MAKTIRTAIIGCGGIADGKHLPSIKKVPDVEIVALCDILPERIEYIRNRYNLPDAKGYTDYKELLKDESIDVVHVCTPNRSHSFITIDALNAGKHVICEKPMAKTSAEAHEMVAAAKKSGKLLTIGYQGRYRNETMYLKKAIDAGELGEIYYAKAHALRRRAVPTWGVFLNEYEQGGGPLIDIGTHALDLTLWEMNNYEPQMVVGQTFKKLGEGSDFGNAWGDWDPKKYTVEDSAFGFIRMKNGATIYLESSWALNTLEVIEASTTLCGTKGGADMRDGLRLNTVKHNTQVVEKPDCFSAGVAFYEAGYSNPEDVEALVFYTAVRGEGELVVLPEQACVVTDILEAIYTSSKTGKPVYFD